MTEPKILLLDIETSPGLGWFFDFKKEYNIVEVKQQPFLLSIAWQWLGDDSIHVKTIRDFNEKAEYTDEDDYDLCNLIHELFGKADVIVAHNGNQFDVKFINARLIKHRFTPPSPYQTADTLTMHRSIASVPSHRLDYLARYYGIGHKLPHSGKDTWLGCLRNDKTSWNTMVRYNRHDVLLLRELYLLIRGWPKTHPNLARITGNRVCPRCHSKNIIMRKRHLKYVMTRQVSRYSCNDCGRWFLGESEPLDTKLVMR